MRTRQLLFPLLAALVGCGGTGGSTVGPNTPGAGSAALTAATPSFAALSIDQEAGDATVAALATDPLPGALVATAPTGDGCHPHLFLRQREVVERVNRHIYKALRHVEAVIARNPLSSTETSKTWESTDGGIDRRFTITLVDTSVYSWELDIGPVGTTPLPVAMTGKIDRSLAVTPHDGKGSFSIDFAKLHDGYRAERVSQGTLAVQFDVSAASRTLTVTATNLAWDLDHSRFDSAAVVSALSAPRSGAYVYFREPGKGGSLKIADQMVFACPANPSLTPADAQLVSRWYKFTDGSIHGRSDALMKGGQLAAPVDHVYAVTCHLSAHESDAQDEGFWLVKTEDATGNTLDGESSTHLNENVTACDPALGTEVPDLQGGANDFTGWPARFDDGVPVGFPGI